MAKKERGPLLEGMDEIERKIALELRKEEGENEISNLQATPVHQEVPDETDREQGSVDLSLPKLREHPGPDKRRGEEEGKIDGRGTSGRISEPDFETVSIEAGTNFLQRLLELYRKGAEIIDRRKADVTKTHCTVCGEPFPEGRHRGESVFNLPNDPNRYQVFRFCSDRCALIFNQNTQAYRSQDQSLINRIRREYFVKRFNK